MTRYVAWIAAGLLVIVHGAPVKAQGIVAPVTSPVDHPLVAAHPVRTAGVWRQGVGRFGESLAGGSLRLRGYEVIDMKLPGNQGIDLVAVKRSAAGSVADLRLIEVKTHYGSSKPHLGQTRVGTQMSREWLADRLRGALARAVSKDGSWQGKFSASAKQKAFPWSGWERSTMSTSALASTRSETQSAWPSVPVPCQLSACSIEFPTAQHSRRPKLGRCATCRSSTSSVKRGWEAG